MTDLRPLGSRDLLVSAVGLGCNNFGRPGFVTEALPATKAVLDAAIDHGVTFLDTAAMYGSPAGTSESLMGEALRGRRDEVVLATKFGHRGGGPEGAEGWGARGAATYVDQAVEGSLRRLQTDRIDLFQMHTPDEDTPIGETLEALARHVEAGRVGFLGHSNFTAEQNEIVARSTTPFKTYIDENVMSFIDGTRDMSEWDAFVDETLALGNMDEVLATYEEAEQVIYSTERRYVSYN